MAQTVHSYTVLFEPAEEGGYVVHVPALPGCVTQGETLDEAREMAADAIRLYLEVLEDEGRPIPPDVSTPAMIEKLEIAMGA
ncbi:MAG: type II toxin-antitoxin system HicB family antitoxin [Deltaproteobacteria bacterium]|nr:type II toxin-antitoxin system HicB family antitoxin [Deltaproteobacteria bacterium]